MTEIAGRFNATTTEGRQVFDQTEGFAMNAMNALQD
ncbi:MAG: hypothetical protein ACI8R4_002209, partial [Paracoccaceae bacterium]